MSEMEPVWSNVDFSNITTYRVDMAAKSSKTMDSLIIDYLGTLKPPNECSLNKLVISVNFKPQMYLKKEGFQGFSQLDC
jgi:hypothetical protein